MYGPNELYHYGTPQVGYNSPTGSGRYRKGTGENPNQHEDSFYASVRSMERQGLSEKEIAEAMGVTIRELRAKKSYSKDLLLAAEYSYILDLKQQGYSNVAIGEKIGKSESYIRNRLKAEVEERAKITQNTVDVLKDCLKDHDYIDIGPGTESILGISDTKLKTAVQKLKDEGYEVHNIQVEQAANPGKYTTVAVLTPPGHDDKEVFRNRDQIVPVLGHYSEDGGKSYLGIEPPTSIDSSRLKIRYSEDGGTAKDGVIELRRGVEDLSLGNANYAQVRIAVDGTHYLKGMAIYSDKMPDGVDIIFNTNKSKDVPALGPKGNTVLKPLKDDPDNPFGSTLKMEDGEIVGQKHYTDKNGNEKLSPINIVREEGDWNTWNKTLSSQFLSKQPKELIKQQLDLTLADKKAQYDEIISIPQNEIRAKLLDDFADECDSASAHLKAVGLPRQSSKVILPLTTIKDDEVYAPTYKEGEQVALIRYPHGGTFEIPILKVNNHIPEGNSVITKKSIDAVGISPKVAERLSGADFDGDTVTVIPIKGQKIISTPALAGLKDFDPKSQYKKVEGMKVMTKKQTQTEMGKISNLITDMTAKGATEDELARAVRHSMVVIDAEKHELNYKQSEVDNGIRQLKTKYQGGPLKGASTIISLAGKEERIPQRKEGGIDPSTGKRSRINTQTGEKLYSKTNATYYKPVKDKDGNTVSWKKVARLEKVEKMKLVDDAFTLSSGTAKENIYAKYANDLKALANKSRLEAYNTESSKTNRSAKELYSNEVASLNKKLESSLLNKPYERQAQIYANVVWSAKKKANPNLDLEDKKKIKTQALAEGRSRFGAKKQAIIFTEKEWEAIQAGAISSSKLKRILENADSDYLKQFAMPRDDNSLNAATAARIHNYSERGYTLSEIADAVGVSTTTVSRELNKKESKE